MRLSRKVAAFDSHEYIFELKIDGFRSLAYIENGECRLVSRNGNTFGNFKNLAQWIAHSVGVETTCWTVKLRVLTTPGGHSLMTCCFAAVSVFVAFDLLFLNGQDLRGLPLLERKARLKRLLRRKRSRILYVDHIDAQGRRFFEKICKLDLEGIVAKRKSSS